MSLVARDAKAKTHSKGKGKDRQVGSGPGGEDRPEAGRMSGLLRVGVVLLVLAVLAAVLYGQRRRLLAAWSGLPATAAVVKLAEVPRWMPPELVRAVLADIQVAAGDAEHPRSIFDAGLVRDVYRRAAANPWVARVQEVRREPDGRVLVRCEFRRPFALVRSLALPAQKLIPVDAEGVVLPVRPQLLRPGAFVIIGDVASRPPTPGQKWDAPDLADGLRLLKLICEKPYAKEITAIDVRNYNGRISPREPHLRIWAQVGRGLRTDIRFGRFPTGDDDYCVSPARKIAYLDKFYRDNGGRLAGQAAFLDLRFDKLHVSLR